MTRSEFEKFLLFVLLDEKVDVLRCNSLESEEKNKACAFISVMRSFVDRANQIKLASQI